MTHSFKLSRRIARLRSVSASVLVFALAGCGDNDAFDPDSSLPGVLNEGTVDALGEDVTLDDTVLPAGDPTLASASYAGGIPFGTFSQPTSEFGSTFSGGHRIIYPQYLLKELAAIKARGGKVIVRLSFGDRYIKNSDGTFSLSKWKAMVDRYKDVNFGPYVNDGTIIGHYLIDEPQDKANWNGQPIPPATIEEMARHSKQRWPNLVTIVRTWPDYLAGYKGSYRYLDAAWAQYAANRWPNAGAFLEENVSKARAKGLALVVGMNIIHGSPTKGQMSPSQLRTYGSALLGSSYPCAFISWQYRDTYINSSGVRDAMRELRNKAQNRSFKSCKAS